MRGKKKGGGEGGEQSKKLKMVATQNHIVDSLPNYNSLHLIKKWGWNHNIEYMTKTHMGSSNTNLIEKVCTTASR